MSTLRFSQLGRREVRRAAARGRSSRDGQGSPPPRQIPCNQLRSCPAVRLGRAHVRFDRPRLQLAAPVAEVSERVRAAQRTSTAAREERLQRGRRPVRGGSYHRSAAGRLIPAQTGERGRFSLSSGVFLPHSQPSAPALRGVGSHRPARSLSQASPLTNARVAPARDPSHQLQSHELKPHKGALTRRGIRRCTPA